MVDGLIDALLLVSKNSGLLFFVPFAKLIIYLVLQSIVTRDTGNSTGNAESQLLKHSGTRTK